MAAHENSVPAGYSLQKEGQVLPVRLLDQFAIQLVDQPLDGVGLEELENAGVHAFVTGQVLPQEGNAAPLHIRTGPIHDWCIDYGLEPCICIITATAWYRLVRPSKGYSPLFEAAVTKLDLAVRAQRVLVEDQCAEAAEVQARVLSGGLAGTSSHSYTAQVLAAEAPFLYGQLQTLQQGGALGDAEPANIPRARRSSSSGGAPVLPPFLQQLHNQTAALLEAAEGNAGRGIKRAHDADEGELPGPSKRQCSSPERQHAVDAPMHSISKLKALLGRSSHQAAKKPPPVVKGGLKVRLPGAVAPPGTAARPRPSSANSSGGFGAGFAAMGGSHQDAEDEEYDAAGRRLTPAESEAMKAEQLQQRESERRHNRRVIEVRERQRREQAAHAERGSPPEPNRGFRVPADMLPEVIAMWELLQSFAAHLQLSPFPLEALEAALCPGPFPSGRTPYQEAAHKAPAHPSDGSPSASAVPTAAASPAAAGSGGVDFSAVEPSPATTIHGAPGATAMEGVVMDGLIHDGAHSGAVGGTADGRADGITPGTADWTAGNGHNQCSDDAPADVPVTDPVNAASSLLLRDVHLALLRCVEGTGSSRPKKASAQPDSARLQLDELLHHRAPVAAQNHWTQRVSACLLNSGMAAVGEDAWNASLQVRANDYIHATPQQRFAMLRALGDLAMASEPLREHITARLDALLASRPKAEPPPWVQHQQQQQQRQWRQQQDGMYGEEGEEDEEAPAGSALLPESWVQWMEQQRLGVRKPLGSDYLGRRYWALGGRAAAWRVYVEEAEGAAWGWYEGPGLVRLMHWLRAGAHAIECEVPLLLALHSAPLPLRKGAGPPVPPPPAAAAYAGGHAARGHAASGHAHTQHQHQQHGAWGAGPVNSSVTQPPLYPGTQTLDSVEGSDGPPERLPLPEPSDVLNPDALQRRRPNGYSQLVAPYLYGECSVKQGSNLPSSEERLRASLLSMMGRVPYWLQHGASLQKQAAALQNMRHAHAPAELSQCVAAAEAALSEAEMLSTEWSPKLQAAWRTSLAGQSGSEADLRSVALHLASLQQAMVADDWAIHREAFMRIVVQARCPLIFPKVGEDYYLSRSGLLAHLERYLRLPDDATAPLAATRPEVQACKEQAQRLRPIQRFTVAGVAYRMYPMPEAAPAPAAVQGTEATQGGAGAAAAGAVGAVSGGGDVGAAMDGGGMEQQQQQQQQQQVKEEMRHHTEAAQQAPADMPQGSAQPLAAQPAGATAQGGPPQAAVALAPLFRPPCLWVLLVAEPNPAAVSGTASAVSGAGADGAEQQGSAVEVLAVPIHIDNALSDFIIPTATYEAGCSKVWHAGERFRMYFGGRLGSKVRGTYYYGTIIDVNDTVHPGDAATDPWESVTVAWDVRDSKEAASQQKVSPWEIEVDVEVQRRTEDAKKREMDASERLARALQRTEELAAAPRGGRVQRASAAAASAKWVEESSSEDEDGEKARRKEAAAAAAAAAQLQQQQQQQQLQRQQQQRLLYQMQQQQVAQQGRAQQQHMVGAGGLQGMPGGGSGAMFSFPAHGQQHQQQQQQQQAFALQHMQQQHQQMQLQQQLMQQRAMMQQQAHAGGNAALLAQLSGGMQGGGLHGIGQQQQQQQQQRHQGSSGMYPASQGMVTLPQQGAQGLPQQQGYQLAGLQQGLGVQLLQQHQQHQQNFSGMHLPPQQHFLAPAQALQAAQEQAMAQAHQQLLQQQQMQAHQQMQLQQMLRQQAHAPQPHASSALDPIEAMLRRSGG